MRGCVCMHICVWYPRALSCCPLHPDSLATHATFAYAMCVRAYIYTPHMCKQSRTYTHTHNPRIVPLSFSLPHTHTYPLAYTNTLSLSHTYTYTHTHIPTPSLLHPSSFPSSSHLCAPGCSTSPFLLEQTKEQACVMCVRRRCISQITPVCVCVCHVT
jgi:hypothetical protein